MKRFAGLCVLLFAAFSLGYALRDLQNETRPHPLPPEESGTRVEVILFRGGGYCPVCDDLERNTQETLEGPLSGDVAAGRLSFRKLSLEEPENERYIETYGLFGTTLVVSLVRNGREVRFRNLEEAYRLADRPEAFRPFFLQALAPFLKEAVAP